MMIRRAQSHSSRREGFRRGYSVGAGASGLAMVASAISMLGLAVTVGSRPSGAGDFLVRFLPFAAVAVAIGMAGSAQASRSKKQQQTRLRRNAKGEALYFRPFTFDMTTETHETRLPQGMFSEGKLIVSMEEVLEATCLNNGLRLKSIGRLATVLGPETTVTPDSEWQELAVGLMIAARLIVVVPGSSPGSYWELQEIKSRKFLGKTLWVMPPAPMSSRVAELTNGWAQCGSRCRAELGLAFPKYVSTGALFSYDDATLEITIRPFDFGLIEQCVALAAYEAR